MNLKILDVIGNDKLAKVYIAETAPNRYLEFAESIQPPLTRNEKWVLVISVLYGCPVGCLICDAGHTFAGKLSKEEVLAQIDYLVNLRYPNQTITNCLEFKIQFARMGEPTFNSNVLEVLEELPKRYNGANLIPSISTIAPHGCDVFMSKLQIIKNRLYARGKFQMQFSIHTTDVAIRDSIIPVAKWDFKKIANFSENFYAIGDKKITLNFALAQGAPISAKELTKYFSPDLFIIKITPINPTINSSANEMLSYFVTGDMSEDSKQVIARLRDAGYDVILSIGELEENQIGSNCGQFIRKFVANNSANFTAKAYGYAASNRSI